MNWENNESFLFIIETKSGEMKNAKRENNIKYDFMGTKQNRE